MWRIYSTVLLSLIDPSRFLFVFQPLSNNTQGSPVSDSQPGTTRKGKRSLVWQIMSRTRLSIRTIYSQEERTARSHYNSLTLETVQKRPFLFTMQMKSTHPSPLSNKLLCINDTLLLSIKLLLTYEVSPRPNIDLETVRYVDKTHISFGCFFSFFVTRKDLHSRNDL
jgi:hypothetical protein